MYEDYVGQIRALPEAEDRGRYRLFGAQRYVHMDVLPLINSGLLLASTSVRIQVGP